MLYHPTGCSACRQTGYRGRAAIAECMEMTSELQRLIFDRADHARIEGAAISSGMKGMFDAGLDAALAGETTIEEVVRSVRTEG